MYSIEIDIGFGFTVSLDYMQVEVRSQKGNIGDVPEKRAEGTTPETARAPQNRQDWNGIPHEGDIPQSKCTCKRYSTSCSS